MPTRQSKSPWPEQTTLKKRAKPTKSKGPNYTRAARPYNLQIRKTTKPIREKNPATTSHKLLMDAAAAFTMKPRTGA